MELRLYCFVNYYLSSIQQGIQTGHAAVEMVRKYTRDTTFSELAPRKAALVADWADNHKTFVTLNGGNNSSILSASEIIAGSVYPFATFDEDRESLGGIQTCVAVVLPETIFNAKFVRYSYGDQPMPPRPYFEYTNPISGEKILYDEKSEEFDLLKLVTGARLAQ